MNRFAAYCIIFLSITLGGGSLILFITFLIFGPCNILRFNTSEAQVLIWDCFLSILFFIQHSGMIRTSFRAWLSASIPRHYHAAAYSIMSGIVLSAVVLLWQPSQTVLFQLHGPIQLLPRAFSLLAISGFIWGGRALRTFDPFGRIPIKLHLSSKQLRPQGFILCGPYLWVRHPLYSFMVVLMSAAPSMKDSLITFLMVTDISTVSLPLRD